MTLIRSEPDTEAGGATALLRAAEAHYREALEDLLAMKMYLKDRDDLPETEIRRVGQAYGRATQTLFDERKKLEEQLKRERGIAGDHALDFDAARDEIGGRLSRLRERRRAE
ncbi:hypothetical protein EKE94_08940 [Mesobaculum littorinae]|uniref:Uncharacterized protein n=1 Tax=Mesobaculum littorinae TaxID=2486419 RepID=A0A438AK25_9RHOB|nr:hypothetical protein [Mesobaculum littorinae]RVV98994.1 hypothetical protein EKE94_08940 [Mesobaculum littorinae]